MNNNRNNRNNRKSKKQLKGNYARFSGIAIQMFVIIALGTYIGVKLDEKHPNKHDLFTVSFALGSVILAIVFVIRRILAASKDD